MNTQLLEQPFSPQEIKQREGSFGKTLDYLEGATVINRLNKALDHKWSVEVVSHEIVDDEIVVLVKLTTEGIVKTQFGSAKIKKHKETRQPISIGEDFKAATTDAIKKASTLLGVGLHLYQTEAPANNGGVPPSIPAQADPGGKVHHFPSIPRTTTHNSSPASTRATNKQLNYLLYLAKNNLGWDNKTVEREALDRFGVEFRNLTSRDAHSFIEELKQVNAAVGH